MVELALLGVADENGGAHGDRAVLVLNDGVRGAFDVRRMALAQGAHVAIGRAGQPQIVAGKVAVFPGSRWTRAGMGSG